jgi:hypothetical protein
MADPQQKPASPAQPPRDDVNLAVALNPGAGKGDVTARKAGGLTDMQLPVSPKAVDRTTALENMAKAINVALQGDFLETKLEPVYKAARVYEGAVQIQHEDYMGLGDGVFASVGKSLKSFELTFRGPDPASPEGKAWIEKHGGGSIRGFLGFLGRKLDLMQEFEDKVPSYVEQMLDRLEAAKMITGWNRTEWEISTQLIGLDVVITPK